MAQTGLDDLGLGIQMEALGGMQKQRRHATESLGVGESVWSLVSHALSDLPAPCASWRAGSLLVLQTFVFLPAAPAAQVGAELVEEKPLTRRMVCGP